MANVFTRYQCYVEDRGRGLHNLNADVLKVAITNTAPNTATHKVLADITEISAAHGYSAGGMTVASNAYSQTAGVARLTGLSATVTASGGNVGPGRWFVLYNSTSSAKNLIGFWDQGISATLTSGNIWSVDIDPALGILTDI